MRDVVIPYNTMFYDTVKPPSNGWALVAYGWRRVSGQRPMRAVSGTPYLTPGGLRGGRTPGDPQGTLQTIDISDVPFPLPLFPSSGVNRPGQRLRLGSARDASPGRGICRRQGRRPRGGSARRPAESGA